MEEQYEVGGKGVCGAGERIVLGNRKTTDLREISLAKLAVADLHTCITMATHCSFEMLVSRAAIMTNAVMKVTPLFVSWMVPGSAIL